jgi:hypothetical protein
MDPRMMEDESVQQGPEQAPRSLQERVVSLLKEDLSIPPNKTIQVRQAPLQDGEDHDSWADSDDPNAFNYLAQQLIEMIETNEG